MSAIRYNTNNDRVRPIKVGAEYVRSLRERAAKASEVFRYETRNMHRLPCARCPWGSYCPRCP